MLYGPDCSSSDEEGLSDDNEYYEFKSRIKKQNELRRNYVDSEAEQKKKKLQSIITAITYGKDDFIDDGLEVDVDLDQGWTPLLLSASVANVKISSTLLRKGAKIDQTRDGLTPLMLACNNSSDDESVRNGVTACVKLLIDNNADIKAIDNKRRTAIMLAAYNGHLEAVKLLLPLVDKETEDNQRWNVLFWAVEGHRTEIVKLLLNEDFNCDKLDIRGNTVMDIAHMNGFEDILELLPKNPHNDEFYIHLSNNFNFEDTFNNLHKSEKPQFFVDICKILYGTKSESVVSIMQENKITLLEFLSLSDSKLNEMGIQLPYQRNRIMGGLYKFHKHPFTPKSIPFVKKNELYTDLDISSTVLSCVRQLIAMEASLKFIIENNADQLSLSEMKEIGLLIKKNRIQINVLKTVSQQFVSRTEMWDSTLKPVDKITKKRRNIPWCTLYYSLGIISLAALIALKIY